jgi:hypothetical protein
VPHLQLNPRTERERESFGQLGHPMPKGTDPATQVVRRHLKAKQPSGFARRKLDESPTIEAK